MLAVIARAYINSVFLVEDARPSRCAIAPQRNADATLLRIATHTAPANSHGSTPARERARVRGSTYQMTRARSAAPAKARNARFTFCRAARFSQHLPRLIRPAQHVELPSLRLVIDADQQLADETGGNHLPAHQCQQHAEQQQRPAADIVTETELLPGEPGQDTE